MNNIPTNVIPATPQREKLRRGFAAMPSELQREIASRGGQSAQRTGRAHQFTSEEARAAVARKLAIRATTAPT